MTKIISTYDHLTMSRERLSKHKTTNQSNMINHSNMIGQSRVINK